MSDLMEQLGELPERDIDALRAAKLRHQMKRELHRHKPRQSPAIAWLGRAYFRAEPLMIAAVCVAYIGWAFKQAMGI